MVNGEVEYACEVLPPSLDDLVGQLLFAWYRSLFGHSCPNCLTSAGLQDLQAVPASRLLAAEVLSQRQPWQRRAPSRAVQNNGSNIDTWALAYVFLRTSSH